MKRLTPYSLALALVVGCSLLVQAQEPAPGSAAEARGFSSPEGGFTISLPEKLSAQGSQPVRAGAATIDAHFFAWTTPRGEYSVMYMDMPKLLEDPAISKAVLDNARDSGVKKENGRLSGERDLSLDGHAGREFKIEAPDGTFLDRVYLVGKRLYVITVFVPTAQATAEAFEAAGKILDSFKFLKGNEAPAK